MQGTDALYRKLNALKAIRQEVIDLNDDIATDVEIAAVRDAPDGISQKIQKYAQNGGLVVGINVNAGNLGAYVEFGTGASAAALVPTLPDEWQDTARKFYINGQGKLHATPYLYPNWARYTVGYRDKVLAIVRKAADVR